jgi:hypothetical protein
MRIFQLYFIHITDLGSQVTDIGSFCDDFNSFFTKLLKGLLLRFFYPFYKADLTDSYYSLSSFFILKGKHCTVFPLLRNRYCVSRPRFSLVLEHFTYFKQLYIS